MAFTKNLTIATTVMALLMSTASAFAQDRHDDQRDDNRGGHPAQRGDDRHDDHRDGGHGFVRHDEWHKGFHMRQDDWGRGRPVDYRTYHLHRPPHGYEWREVDGNYVLAAVATGIIASVVIAATH